MVTKIKGLFVFLGIAAMMFVSTAFADEYQIDVTHSTIGFAVKHLMVSTVRGSFSDYTGAINFDKNDVSVFKADVTIQAKSIDTKVANRDNHLRGADFFDVEKFPEITFKSSSLKQSGDMFEIAGDLTMHGVTKPIVIPVTIAGPVKGMAGDDVIGITGEVMINRQDFGVSWSKQLDGGGVVVDDRVLLTVEVEAHKK